MTKVVFIDGEVIHIDDFTYGTTMSLNETLSLERVGSKYKLAKNINNLNEVFVPIMEFLYKEDDKGKEYGNLYTDTNVTYIGYFETIAQLLKDMYNIKIEITKNVELKNDDVNVIKTMNDDGNRIIKIHTRKHEITLPMDGTSRIIINDSKKFCIISFLDYEINGGDDNGQPDKVEDNTD